MAAPTAPWSASANSSRPARTSRPATCRFTPVANAAGSPYTSFGFRVQDDGGTANGGADLASNANTMTINVLQVHQQPVGSDGTATTLEEAAYTLKQSDFGFSDPNDTPPDAFVGILVAPGVSTGGTLKLDGSPVSAGQQILLAQIVAGQLSSRRTSTSTARRRPRSSSRCRTTAARPSAARTPDSSPNTLSITITAVNDRPSAARQGDQQSPGQHDAAGRGPLHIQHGRLRLQRYGRQSVAPNAIQAVKITTVPTAGTLMFNGAASLRSELPIQAYGPDRRPAWSSRRPEQATAWRTAASRSRCRTTAAPQNGGVDTDSTPNTITLDVTPVNDEPAGLPTLKIRRFHAHAIGTPTFTQSDFGFSDANDQPTNGLLNVIITSAYPKAPARHA